VEIVIQNNAREKSGLVEALQAFVAEHHLPASVLNAADLALEEHLTNVINYGYDDKEVHEIRVRLTCDEVFFHIEVEDDARPFNPLARGEVDVSAPLDDRQIGGLGVHLMRRFMDGLDYRREGQFNILHMKKRFKD
jgi:anti-sigma regulatory factor (Ser/Thr protein kinase)